MIPVFKSAPGTLTLVIFLLSFSTSVFSDENAKAQAMSQLSKQWKDFTNVKDYQKKLYSPYIGEGKTEYVSRPRLQSTRLDPIVDRAEWLGYLAEGEKNKFAVRRDKAIHKIESAREIHSYRATGLSVTVGEIVAVGGCILAATTPATAAAIGPACIGSQFLNLGVNLMVLPALADWLDLEENARAEISSAIEDFYNDNLKQNQNDLQEAGDEYFRLMEELENSNLPKEEKEKILRNISDPERIRKPGSIKVPVNEPQSLNHKIKSAAKKYYQKHEIYAENANSAVALVNELFGAESVPRELSFAVSAYSTSLNASSQLATGNYFGAALSVVGLFGNKNSDPMAPVLASLSVINRKLDALLDGQRRILENQRRIIETLDRIETDIHELSDQQYLLSSRILVAIQADKASKINSCIVFGNELERATRLQDSEVSWKDQDLSTNVYNSLRLDRLTDCLDLVDSISVDYAAERKVNPYLLVLTNPANDVRSLRLKGFYEDYYQPLLEYYWARAIGITNDQRISCRDSADTIEYGSKVGSAYAMPFYVPSNVFPQSQWRQPSASEIDRVFEGDPDCLLDDLIVFDELARIVETISSQHWIYSFLQRNNVVGGELKVWTQEREKFLSEIPMNNLSSEARQHLDTGRQLLELASAQASILDGRALLPHMREDLLSQNASRQKSLIEVLSASPNIQRNFLTFLIGAEVEKSGLSSREYLGLVSFREPRAVEDWLNALFSEQNLQFDVRCVSNELCDDDKYGTYRSDMELMISRSDDHGLEGLGFGWMELPGGEVVASGELLTHPKFANLQAALEHVEDEVSMFGLENGLAGQSCDVRVLSRKIPGAKGLLCQTRKKNSWARYLDEIALHLISSEPN